jgi:type II secretory pathway component PulK
VVDEIHRQARGADGRRLVSVDDLRTRDFMNGQNYGALNKRLFTVYTSSSDATRAAINLNSANPTVLAAVFAIGAEEAESLAQKRPFESWDDVRAKVGRETSTFNVPDTARTNRRMPDAVSLGSRSYRLISEAHMITRDTSARGLQSAVEAVVNFAADGSFSIPYWNATPSDEAFLEAETTATAPVPAEPAGGDTVDDSGEVTEEPKDADTAIE